MSNERVSAKVSAPGKILLAGGYLVLESPNVGLAVTVDKRFYTMARITQDSTDDSISICVQSPQFGQTYHYEYKKNTGLITQNGTNENVFVQKTLRVALLYLRPSWSHLELTIQADNEFYSLMPHLEKRRLDRSLGSVCQLPPFLSVLDDGNETVRKTGLGSSAALVTSLVAALFCLNKPTTCRWQFQLPTGDFQAFSPSLCESIETAFVKKQSTFVYHMNNTEYRIDLNSLTQYFEPDDSQQPVRRILNDISTITHLAHIAHCHAQGKIGSGFDISAACYGSHIYQRFDPETIRILLEQLDLDYLDSDETIHSTLQTCVDKRRWGELCVISPVQFKANGWIQVMLADVSGGSESPSMARTVLKWKNSATEIDNPWVRLQTINQRIVDLFQSVTASDCIDLRERKRLSMQTLNQCVLSKEDADSVSSRILALKTAFAEARQHLNCMGQLAGVPIEPTEQGLLIDATMNIPGVVAALVPGAGGFDAMACIYINESSTRDEIAKLWSEWNLAKVCPLNVSGVGYGNGINLEQTD
jgi:phosphomevalonate kinase